MSTMTQNQITELVQSFLDEHQPRGYKLKVVQEGIRQDDDWWYVTVVPDRKGVRAYDYADRLSEAEEKLSEKESINVLLVPTLVDD